MCGTFFEVKSKCPFSGGPGARGVRVWRPGKPLAGSGEAPDGPRRRPSVWQTRHVLGVMNYFGNGPKTEATGRLRQMEADVVAVLLEDVFGGALLVSPSRPDGGTHHQVRGGINIKISG